MNSKKIFKRTLPILITLFVVIVVALISTVATFSKRVPTFSSDEYGEEGYITYTKGDVTVKLSRNQVYAALKNSSNSLSSAVSELVDIIDTDLLSDYIAKVEEQDVYDQVTYAIFGKTFDEYVKSNKTTFEVNAKKENMNYVDYLKEQIDEKIEDFVESQKTDYALSASINEFTYLDNGNFMYVQEDGTDKLDDNDEKIYQMTVSKDSDTYEVYCLAVARHNYGFDELLKDYKEDLVEYNEYLDKVEEYNKYTTAVSRYEEELNIWNNTAKDERGDKPVKPNKKDFKVIKEPEVVEAPILVETDFQNKYNNDKYNTYNAIVIPYASESQANMALLQNDIVIKKNTSGVYTWFNTITNNELTEEEIKKSIVDLYNQFYQQYPDKQLDKGTDYTVVGSNYNFTVDGLEKIELTQSEASTYGVYSAANTNNFNKFLSNGINEFKNTYSNQVVVSTNYSCLYLIVAKTSVLDWEDYLNEEKYYDTDFYNEVLEDLIDDKTTTAYINQYVAELRYENNILIYDTDFESKYMSTYVSDYTTIKKISKDSIASYEVDGVKKYIKLDDFFDAIASKYAVSAFVEQYQYDWVFLKCANNENELFNKYFDYTAYLNGTKFDKCIKSNDEAKELANDAKEYADEIYNNFKKGAYVTEEGGYPASYGWENFLRDYYYTNYQWNKISNIDDLKVFYIYQEIISDYREYIAKVSKDTYENMALIYMAQTLSDYINSTASTFNISVLDEDGNKVDPTNWTNTQISSAAKLYDEVLTVLNKVDSENIATVLGEIIATYNAAPLALLNGTTPNVEGAVYNYNYFAKGSDTPITVHCTEYKSLGLVIDYSSSITVLSSTDEIISAARNIWDSILPELMKNVSYNDSIIFDHEFTPDNYLSEDNVLNMVNSKKYLMDANGMHIYINLSSSMSTYMNVDNKSYDDDSLLIHAKMYAYEQTNKDNTDYKSFEDLYKEYKNAVDKTTLQETIMSIVTDKMNVSTLTFAQFVTYLEEYVYDENTLIGFPSYVHVLMYLYDKTKSSETDYESFDDLYDDYIDAVEEDGTNSTDDTKAAITTIEEKIMNIVKDELELGSTIDTFEKFKDYLVAYADSDTSSYVTSQITTWFTAYSSTSSTLIYGDLTSSYYVQLKMFESLVKELDSITYANADTKELCEKTIANFIEQYYNDLPVLSMFRGDKESVETLLKAMISKNHLDLYTSDLDALFKYNEYATEKEILESAFEALKTYTKNAYNALTNEEKAELNDLYKAVYVID